MKKDKKTILNQNLSDLISKYGQTNVLEQLEKEYLTLPLKQVETKDIFDSSYLEKVVIKQETIENIVFDYSKNRIIEPIVVREYKGKYEVVSGRKRLAAAKLLQIEFLQVIVANYTDEETLLVLLAHARDEHKHNPLELSYILCYLVKEYKYKHDTLGKLTFLSRSQVTNILRLQKLPDVVLHNLSEGRLSFGHARALIGVNENEVNELVNAIINTNLTVRELEELLKKEARENTNAKKRRVIRTKNKVSVIFSSEAEAIEFSEKLVDNNS